ncbi:hypothetical protein GE21DRAFT_1325678 [Neurospora crassa]|nr:hypothetical protein GE21DRAFT_1325678 [Neurospora crassa]
MFLIESSGDDLLPIFSLIDRYEFPTPCLAFMTCDIYLDQEPKRRRKTKSVIEPRSVGGVIGRGEGKQLIGDP